MIFRQITVVFGTAVFIVMYFSANKFFEDIEVLAEWYKSIVGTVWLGRKQLAIVMALLPALLILWYADVLRRLAKSSGWAIGSLGVSALAYFMFAGWPLVAPSALLRTESIGFVWGWAFHVVLICALVAVLLEIREGASPESGQ